MQIKILKLFTICFVFILFVTSVYAVGITPAKKILTGDDSYTISVLSNLGDNIILSASDGVELSETDFVVGDDGEYDVDVKINYDILIPGENTLEISALNKKSQSGQVVVQEEVVHKLIVYKDSDEDYIRYRSFADRNTEKIGIYGEVLSKKTIDRVDLDIAIDDIKKNIYVNSIKPKEDFELSFDYKDLDIKEGYYDVLLNLVYGEKKNEDFISFTYGKPKVKFFETSVESVGDISKLLLSFGLDWNRPVDIISSDVLIKSNDINIREELPGAKINPGNNSLELFVKKELSLGSYTIIMNVTTSDGEFLTVDSFSILEEKEDLSFVKKILIFLLLICIILVIYFIKKDYFEKRK